jgi:hypothetical protein
MGLNITTFTKPVKQNMRTNEFNTNKYKKSLYFTGMILYIF